MAKIKKTIIWFILALIVLPAFLIPSSFIQADNLPTEPGDINIDNPSSNSITGSITAEADSPALIPVGSESAKIKIRSKFTGSVNIAESYKIEIYIGREYGANPSHWDRMESCSVDSPAEGGGFSASCNYDWAVAAPSVISTNRDGKQWQFYAQIVNISDQSDKLVSDQSSVDIIFVETSTPDVAPTYSAFFSLNGDSDSTTCDVSDNDCLINAYLYFTIPEDVLDGNEYAAHIYYYKKGTDNYNKPAWNNSDWVESQHTENGVLTSKLTYSPMPGDDNVTSSHTFDRGSAPGVHAILGKIYRNGTLILDAYGFVNVQLGKITMSGSSNLTKQNNATSSNSTTYYNISLERYAGDVLDVEVDNISKYQGIVPPEDERRAITKDIDQKTFEWNYSGTSLGSHIIKAKVYNAAGTKLLSMAQFSANIVREGTNVTGDTGTNDIDLESPVPVTNLKTFFEHLATGTLPLVITILGFFGIIYGGFLFLTASGNEESIKKGKKAIIYSIIGLVIGVLSYWIVTAVIAELRKIGLIG